MTFTAIIAGIYSISESVPIVADFLKQLNEKYIDLQVEKAGEYIATKEDKMNFLMKKISEAKTDEDLIPLSILLRDIDGM